MRTILVVLLAAVVCSFPPPKLDLMVQPYITETSNRRGPQTITKPTKGSVWPAPRSITTSDEYWVLDFDIFQFHILQYQCAILESALIRYHNMVMDMKTRVMSLDQQYQALKSLNLTYVEEVADVDDDEVKKASKNITKFSALQVRLKTPCQIAPSQSMNEEYELTIDKTSILSSFSLWGILRGLETFSQLFYYTDDLTEIRINMTSIKDSPRYPYRGLMLDTSRHYISKENIFKTLDAMAYNKLNVFHWHIVDDQSFPYSSYTFPNISEMGAFHRKAAVYTLKDISNVIAYATDRGIRVIPEFEMPGHVQSWGHAFPHLLTQCYDKEGARTHTGPFNPIKRELYSILNEFFQEIKDIFIDKYIHLGGDGVDYDCWLSNPEIKRYMFYNRVSPDSLHELFYVSMMSVLPNRYTPIVWQDVLENNVTSSSAMVVQIMNTDDPFINQLSKGLLMISSACWNLNDLERTWKSFYECDPGRKINDKENIVGGTATMFGQLVDDTNIITRAWPRASATAEVLWSDRAPKESEMYKTSASRLEEHACRMRRRGIEAEPPNGPGYCDV